MAQIFLSYSRKDKKLAKMSADMIGGLSGHQLFMDVNNIEPGRHWSQKFIENLRR